MGEEEEESVRRPLPVAVLEGVGGIEESTLPVALGVAQGEGLRAEVCVTVRVPEPVELAEGVSVPTAPFCSPEVGESVGVTVGVALGEPEEAVEAEAVEEKDSEEVGEMVGVTVGLREAVGETVAVWV